MILINLHNPAHIVCLCLVLLIVGGLSALAGTGDSEGFSGFVGAVGVIVIAVMLMCMFALVIMGLTSPFIPAL